MKNGALFFVITFFSCRDLRSFLLNCINIRNEPERKLKYLGKMLSSLKVIKVHKCIEKLSSSLKDKVPFKGTENHRASFFKQPYETARKKAVTKNFQN